MIRNYEDATKKFAKMSLSLSPKNKNIPPSPMQGDSSRSRGGVDETVRELFQDFDEDRLVSRVRVGVGVRVGVRVRLGLGLGLG